MNFLGRMKKAIPIFRAHLTCDCDTTRDQVSSATVPQKHYVPAWTTPDPAGKKVTVPGSMNIGIHSSQRLPVNNHCHEGPCTEVSVRRMDTAPAMDTQGFTTCVTHFIFMSDTLMIPGKGAHKRLCPAFSPDRLHS